MKNQTPMTKMLTMTLACTLVALSPAEAVGQKSKPQPGKLSQRQQQVVSSEAFLSDHPDMLNRMRAMQELERGDAERAANYFKRAAHYADKQSQAGYAELLWKGHGVPQDRPAAYAWMDLASERGYTLFLGFRERYWNALSEQERLRALEVGETIYAEYGDSVAKPRMEKILKRALRKITGSRVGFVGGLTIIIPGPGGGTSINASTYYNKRFWEPKQYWHWQEEVVEGARHGTVTVSDLVQVREAASSQKSADPGD